MDVPTVGVDPDYAYDHEANVGLPSTTSGVLNREA